MPWHPTRPDSISSTSSEASNGTFSDALQQQRQSMKLQPLSTKELAALMETENREDAAELARNAARIKETAGDLVGLLGDGTQPLQTTVQNVEDSNNTVKKTVVVLNEAQKTQQENIRCRLLFALVVSTVVSVGAAAWLVQTIGGNVNVLIAAAVITAAAIAITAVIGALYHCKKQQHNAESANDDSASTLDKSQ